MSSGPYNGCTHVSKFQWLLPLMTLIKFHGNGWNSWHISFNDVYETIYLSRTIENLKWSEKWKSPGDPVFLWYRWMVKWKNRQQLNLVSRRRMGQCYGGMSSGGLSVIWWGHQAVFKEGDSEGRYQPNGILRTFVESFLLYEMGLENNVIWSVTEYTFLLGVTPLKPHARPPFLSGNRHFSPNHLWNFQCLNEELKPEI